MEEEQAYKIKLKLYSDPPPKRRVVFFYLTYPLLEEREMEKIIAKNENEIMI
jgi:hypothetical protein